MAAAASPACAPRNPGLIDKVSRCRAQAAASLAVGRDAAECKRRCAAPDCNLGHQLTYDFQCFWRPRFAIRDGAGICSCAPPLPPRRVASRATRRSASSPRPMQTEAGRAHRAAHSARLLRPPPMCRDTTQGLSGRWIVSRSDGQTRPPTMYTRASPSASQTGSPMVQTHSASL
eukprot:SAG31_NODE_3240_length_4506_cov_2.792830_4_plen_174_part_00